MAPVWLLILGLAALCSALPTFSEDLPPVLDNFSISSIPTNATPGFSVPWQKTKFQFFGQTEACYWKFSSQVNAALTDAIAIASSIDVNFAHDHPIIEDYFKLEPSRKSLGVDSNKVREQIKANFVRLQDTFKNQATDDWFARAVLITCGDTDDIKIPGTDGCNSPNVKAHVVLPANSHYDFPIISLCNAFFGMDSLAIVNGRIAQFPYLAFDATNYISQGTAMLHEMLHLPWPGVVAGISNPTAVDKIIYGLQRDKKLGVVMYGPANAKQLAKASTGGADVAVRNVDNFVYAAVASYGGKKYNVKVDQPAAAWTFVPKLEITDEDAAGKFVGDGADVQDEFTLERSGVRDLPESYYRVEPEQLLSQAQIDEIFG
ncbi:uncharacterized protein RCC_04092 [Ramularia collo-cygni]|uniref:Uncharacterized protein n=1 Tax=Ramularia collo-cygni TaxID=112498 RepID=A0A2D3V0R0_9PEZI|nr:uncharacterized protein RCC_04092 [Ramularia collo-cygni]CZT18247.1 uncharacterized protein RCC_04092 [Ramularia collo-cygni]